MQWNLNLSIFSFSPVYRSNVLIWQFVDETLLSSDKLSIKHSFLTDFDQTFFPDSLLIKRSFPTFSWPHVLVFGTFVDQTFLSDDLSIERFVNALIKALTKRKRSFRWSQVLFWQFVNETFFSDSDVTVELPFTLSHPKPPEETPPPTPAPQQNTPSEEAAGTMLREGRVEQTVFFLADLTRKMFALWDGG